MKQRNFFVSCLIFVLLFLVFVMQARASMAIEDFIVSPMGTSILIEWWTGDETNNTGFYIQRSQAVASGYQRITNFITTDWDGLQSAYYYYFDEAVNPDVIYYYRIEAVDKQGVSSFSGPAPGSTNQMLPTFTVSAGPSPTRTSTATIPISDTNDTPTLTNTATSGNANVTATPVTPGIPSPSPSLTGSPLTQTLTPELTGTVLPSITATLEPLPTILLTFPPTSTQPPQAISQKQTASDTPTPTPVPPLSLIKDLPMRLVSLGVIVVAIWVCLGAFLVFMVRQFRE